jgi:hypothetical protein
MHLPSLSQSDPCNIIVAEVYNTLQARIKIPRTDFAVADALLAVLLVWG